MLSTNFGGYEFKISSLTVAGLGLLCSSNSVQAQIIGDRLTNTQVKLEDNTSHIVGGVQAGNNLFHSFKQFSLNADTTANFNHSLEIDNIFSRVTGGSISQIDGSIQTQGGTNLFLINPAGIIFGANAQLDVGGSFVATTAEQVMFADGAEFSAVNPNEQPILTISSPVGLQYGQPSAITVASNANRGINNPGAGLSIQPGNTLALLGGDVSITRNSLNAVGSNIEIGSIKSGIVDLEQGNSSWNFDYDRVLEYGRINIANRAFINSTGIVNFQGKTIDFASSSGISNFTDAMGEGGIVRLNGSESVSLDSSFIFTQVGQISSDIEEAIAGAGGDILIKAPNIFLTDGSVISAGTLSNGAGGNITLEGSQTIELSSAIDLRPSIISTSTSGIGDGGNINVNASRLTIYDGSQIQAFAGEGKGGTITVDASESIDISGTGILRSQDRAGNITETTLNSGFTASSGFEGLSFDRQPKGESGSLIVSTPELTITDLGNISVNNYGVANAGDIEITTDNLNLDTAATITANTFSGEGGSIAIVAEDLIVLDNQSTISTSSEQDGNGGNVFLKADSLLLLEQNTIGANANQGSGGNVSIDTQGYFVEPNSSVTASSLLEQDGTVEIITLDLNSRLHMGQKEYFPLVAQDYMDTGCGGGQGFAQNQFQNIGRGGIPRNPIKETASLDVLNDFGKNESGAVVQSKSIKGNKINTAKHSADKHQPIFEANSWKTNSQGKIELVAQNNPSALMQSSACRINNQ